MILQKIQVAIIIVVVEAFRKGKWNEWMRIYIIQGNATIPVCNNGQGD